MIYLRRVVGHSMVPSLQPDQVCLFVRRKKFRPGQVVLARYKDREFVKRLTRLQDGRVDLVGDNAADSQDILLAPQNILVGTLLWPRTGNS